MYPRVLPWILVASLSAAVAAFEPIKPSRSEPPPTLWRLAGVEGSYRIEDWSSLPAASQLHEGIASEAEDRLSLVTADATTIDLAREIGPVAVIDELQLGVEVLSSRPGLQLGAQIVLPHTMHASTGQPQRALVFGSSYTRPGAWQRLEISELPVELQRSVRTMQLVAKAPLDSRGAYVERVLLRLRPGRGETTVQMRDVHVRGAVSVDAVHQATGSPGANNIRLASGQPGADWSPPSRARDVPPQVELAGGVLHVQGSPVFPRVAEYFGGPLERARDLGFNMVLLPAPPTRQQEREAQSAGLWLIAPLPELGSAGGESSAAAYPRVVAWHLGQGLTEVDLDATRERASMIRRLDPVRNRPLLASVASGHRAFSRVLDILVLDHQPLCGSVPLARFALELESERRLALPGKAVWMRIPTRIPAEVANQSRALLRDGSKAFDSRLAADQMSRLTWIALSHGMHGLIFDAPGPHAAAEPRDATNNELLLLARQLDVIEPLLVSTGSTRRVVDLGDGLFAGVLSNARTHCVLAWRHDRFDHILPPAERPLIGRESAPLSFVVPGVGEPSEAHLVTTTDTRRLPIAREAGGVRVLTDSLLPRDVVLLTQDAVFAQRIKDLVAARARQSADLERALLASEAIRWQAGARLPAADGPGLREARAALSVVRRERFGPVASLAFLRSSPFDRIAGLHQADLQIATLDRRPLPTPNLLPESDFEGVEAARQSGWQHVQLAGQESTHDIELVTGNVRSGSYCVRIVHREAAALPVASAVEPSVWLSSPRVPLQAGDAIRVSGWVRGGTGHDANNLAVIEDSLGGRPLSLRVEVSDQWQPFVMYRATETQHEWSCRLANCGTGEVCFDGLLVQRIPAETINQLLQSPAVRQSRRVLFDSPRLAR